MTRQSISTLAEIFYEICDITRDNMFRMNEIYLISDGLRLVKKSENYTRVYKNCEIGRYNIYIGYIYIYIYKYRYIYIGYIYR